MTAQIIDGKQVAADMREELKAKVAELKEKNIVPGLAVILVGEDPASQSYVKAKEKLKDNTTIVENFDTFAKTIKEKGGFIKAAWCGSEKCEARIKEETGATIRLKPLEEEAPLTSCICCGKEAEETVYFARSY